MIFLLVILVVALIIAAWYRQQSPSPLLNTLLIVLTLACLGMAVAVWFRPHLEEARWINSSNRIQEAIGFELGRAVAQAYPQGGDVLVLLDGLPGKFPKDGAGADRVKGLQAGLGRGKLHAVPVGYKPASDLEAMEMNAEWSRRGVPFENINAIFAAHQGAVAVVALTLVGDGPHLRVPNQIPPLFAMGIPVIGNDAGSKDRWLDLIRPGALEAVVSQRNVNPETIAASSPLPDVFKTCCEMITPANVAEARSRLTGINQ